MFKDLRILGAIGRGAKSLTEMSGFLVLYFKMMHSVYILYSEKLDRFYTGATSNFDLRMEFHDNPEARKFTAKADDWTLFDKIECEGKSQALSIEKHIKSMKSKTYIKNLKQYPEMKEKLKSRYK